MTYKARWDRLKAEMEAIRQSIEDDIRLDQDGCTRYHLAKANSRNTLTMLLAMMAELEKAD